jgi:hypothetical protein
MAAGLLVMSPPLLSEIDHVATRELGREAALSAATTSDIGCDEAVSFCPRSRMII